MTLVPATAWHPAIRSNGECHFAILIPHQGLGESPLAGVAIMDKPGMSPETAFFGVRPERGGVYLTKFARSARESR